LVGVRLQPTENRVTGTIPDGKAKTRGIAFGTHAAEHLIRLRAHDGRNAPSFFTRPPAPGVWRPTTPGTTMYDSGRELRRDVVDARVWLGIHFRFADTASSDLGVRLADWTADHDFQPVS
jgi:hypothetical protein